MEQRVSVITIGVTDIGRAVTFYRALGWSPAFINDDVAFFQAGGLVVSLWLASELAKDAGLGTLPTPGGICLAHNVGSAAAVDAILAEARAAGAAILKAGSPAPWGGYTGYFADPDGHPWEVAWNPAWPLAADGTVRFAE